MPLALAFVGIVLVLVGVRSTYGDFGAALRSEFTGPANFLYRAAAILMIGVIGYAGEGWRKLSTALMALMVIGLLVTRDRGFFDALRIGVSSAPVTPTSSESTTTAPPSPTASPTGGDALARGFTLLASGNLPGAGLEALRGIVSTAPAPPLPPLPPLPPPPPRPF